MAAEQQVLIIYTIGHSTRPLAELTDMLEEHGIRLLIDVSESRLFPGRSLSLSYC